MKIKRFEKWPNLTKISRNFVINDDDIKMTADKSTFFPHYLNAR